MEDVVRARLLQPCGSWVFASTVEYTMPVTVIPNNAASRTARQARPSRAGLRASWAEVTPLRMLLWMVKKVSGFVALI